MGDRFGFRPVSNRNLTISSAKSQIWRILFHVSSRRSSPPRSALLFRLLILPWHHENGNPEKWPKEEMQPWGGKGEESIRYPDGGKF